MIGQQPLSGFANSQLEHLYIGSGSTSTDALEILQCVHLQYLSLHLAKLNAAFFSAASKHASLQTLNLEGAHFTEPMLKKLADAPHLKTLELPNTNIVPQALDVIAGLPQLLSLDLWHTAIPYEAYTVLAFAQSLQHISVGPEHFASRLTQEQQTKRVDLLIHQLSRINALQSVWLDGMLVTPTQQQQLETRFSKVRIDSPW